MKKKPQINPELDVLLTVRVTAELRNDFVECCEDLPDTTASREIRKFMQRFINRHKY